MATRIGTALWVLENLGELLRQRREALGLTYRDAGVSIGISHSHVWAIERGEKNPGVDSVIAVLRWLDD